MNKQLEKWYIRTEDGHIYCETDPGDIPLIKIGYYSIFNGSPVVKEADNILKLCDGFIIGKELKIYNKSNFDFEKKTVNLGHKNYVKFENLKSIYGVIITFENGIPRIITVAKVNDEGELELL